MLNWLRVQSRGILGAKHLGSFSIKNHLRHGFYGYSKFNMEDEVRETFKNRLRLVEDP